jgi:hypothetical protein
MHVKFKSIVTVVWNNFVRIKCHFYHLVTILWGIFFFFFYSNEKVFYNFCSYIIDESVQMNNVVFYIQDLKGWVLRE